MPITSLISGILPLFYHGEVGGVLCTFGFWGDRSKKSCC
nr:MAG TPA: Magi 5 toxic peptide family [Caudoviricetes sp.]